MVSLSTSNPQSYFHNFGNQGTYTSVNHGSATGVHQPVHTAYKQPAPAAYRQPALAAYKQPAPGVFKQPAPAYSNPVPAYGKTAYHAPAPAPPVKSFYHAPVAKPAAYHAPLPTPYVHHHQPRPSYQHPRPHAQPQPHGPGIEYDREKCAVDYVEKKAEVCVPTFKTDCEAEDVKNGLVIKQQEECYQVRNSSPGNI